VISTTNEDMSYENITEQLQTKQFEEKIPTSITSGNIETVGVPAVNNHSGNNVIKIVNFDFF